MLLKTPIKYFIVLTITLLSFTSSHAQGGVLFNKGLSDLQGDWCCINTVQGFPCRSCCNDNVVYDSHLRITGNIVFCFNYPFEYQGSYELKVSEDTLYCNQPNDSTGKFFYNPSILNDTLIVDGYQFVKSKYQDWIISKLLKDTINTTHLMGEWELVLEYPQYFSLGSFLVKLPFEIAHQIELNPLNELYSERQLFLDVNGKLKPFLIKSISDSRLTLSTLDWYSVIKSDARSYYSCNTNKEFIFDFRKVEN